MAYRDNNKFNRNSGFNKRDSNSRSFERPMMHKATCDRCGKECEVPFKPTQGKPVFCNSCFKDQGSPDSRRFERRDYGRSNFEEKQMFQAICDECGNKCNVPFQPTEGKPIYCSDCFGEKKENGNKHSGTAYNFPKADYNDKFEALNVKLDKILKILNPEVSAEAVGNEHPVDQVSEPQIEEEIEVPEKKKKTKSATN